MKIGHEQMKHLTTLASIGGKEAIKKLDHNERKALQIVVKAIQQGLKTAEITLDSKQFTNLTNKLSSGVGSHKTGSSLILIRFLKGFANLFLGRIGSGDLSDDVNIAYKKMPHNTAAEKLKSMISPLVTSKELIIDYYENKAPKIAMYTILGQNQEVKIIQEQFANKLKDEFFKMTSTVGLGDALSLGWGCLTSSKMQGQASDLWKKYEEVSKLGEAIENNDIAEIRKITGHHATFGLSDAIKNHFISAIDETIEIIKLMNEGLLKG